MLLTSYAYNLHVKARFTQIEGDALRSQLHCAVAFEAERERRRVQAATQFMRLVQIAVGGKQERVAGEFLRQEAAGDFALFLKNDVEQCAAIDGLGDRGAE